MGDVHSKLLFTQLQYKPYVSCLSSSKSDTILAKSNQVFVTLCCCYSQFGKTSLFASLYLRLIFAIPVFKLNVISICLALFFQIRKLFLCYPVPTTYLCAVLLLLFQLSVINVVSNDIFIER